MLPLPLQEEEEELPTELEELLMGMVNDTATLRTPLSVITQVRMAIILAVHVVCIIRTNSSG